MSNGIANDTCRLRVVAPSGWAELALPVHIPLADLIPLLVRNAGADLAEEGMKRGGWVLQRLGEPPLDENHTPATLGLRDGDTLYLRTRESELPAFDFDDLIDGVAAGIAERPDRWREVMTRRLFLGLAAAGLLAGLTLLLIAGPATNRAVAADILAGLLVVLAGLTSRAFGDALAGTLLAGSALPFAALGNLLIVPSGDLLSAPHVLAAGAAVTTIALLGLVAVGDSRAFFYGVLTASGFATIGGLVTMIATLSAAQGAAVTAALVLAATPVLPRRGVRLAGLHLPPLPADRAELQENLDPVPGAMLLNRATAVDRHLTALFAGSGATISVCLVPLGSAPGGAAPALAGLVCLILLLRSRVLTGGWQRLATIAPAVLGLAVLAHGWAVAAPVDIRLTVTVGGAIVLTALFLLGARMLPGRKLLPHWGRAAELIESLAAIGVLPLVLALLGAYSWARGLGG